MTPSDINAEITYRSEERLALLGFLNGPDTPRFISSRVRREVMDEVKSKWPVQIPRPKGRGLSQNLHHNQHVE